MTRKRILNTVAPESVEFDHLYIDILNFQVYTFFSVGYGDLYPVHELGMLFNIIIMLYGLLPFTYLLAKFKTSPDNYVRNYSSFMMSKQHAFDTWLSHIQIRARGNNGKSQRLFKVLRHHFLYYQFHDIRETYDKVYFWKLWPEAQKNLFEEPLNNISSLFSPFFKSIDRESWTEIMFAMKYRTYVVCYCRYVKDTIVIHHNEIPTGLYFILEGEAELSHNRDNKTPIVSLQKGGYFGDSSLLLDNSFLNVK